MALGNGRWCALELLNDAYNEYGQMTQPIDQQDANWRHMVEQWRAACKERDDAHAEIITLKADIQELEAECNRLRYWEPSPF